MDYDALTIDTQTVETNGFHFDGKLLAQLKQFAEGSPEVLVSEVVAHEILRHLRTKTLEAKEAVENAHRRAQLFGLKDATDKPFAKAVDVQTLAKTRLDAFLKDIGATCVPAKAAPMEEIIDLYHQGAPPFSTSGKKKNEFPDAIALISLEQWAKTNNKHILAISGDRDWAAFGETSKHIDVVADLSDALARLQRDADKAAAIVQHILADIKSAKRDDLARQFETLLGEEVASANVMAEGSSAHQFDVDSVEVHLDHFEFVEKDGDFDPQIVQAGRAVIVAGIDLQVFVTADASFSLSTWDSIDDEWVGLGSNTVRKGGEECDIRVLVTFEGDFASGEIDVSKVELIQGLGEIDFGEIEIDYGDPDYDNVADDSEEPAGQPEPVDENEPF